MNKLLAATIFATVGFAAQSAAACDWNRQASTEQPAVATAVPSPQTQQAVPAPSQTSTAAAATDRKPIEAAAPVVLVSDHR